MKRVLLAILAFVAAAFSAATAFAMAVTPVIIDMNSTGKKAVTDITVDNTAVGDIPVAISVTEAFISENGEVKTQAADEMFQIYPPQALIKPNAKQKFKVRWIGDPALQKGRTFIFSVAQQPVKLPEGMSGIQILYNFEVLVSVSPEKGQPEIKIEDVNFQEVEGKRRLAINVQNIGIAHGYLSGAKIKFEAKNNAGEVVWTKTIEPEEIGQNIGAGILQPGAKRKFVLPFDIPEGGEKVTATLKYIGRK